MGRWFECIACGFDVRSGRHNNLCELTVPQKRPEGKRVSSIISTYAGLKPRKGMVLINGGKPRDEEVQVPSM